MKNRTFTFGSLAVCVLLSSFCLITSIKAVGNAVTFDSAFAQVLPPDGGFTPGGGDGPCNGASCDRANDQNYGDLVIGAITHCCGGTSSESGKKKG